LKRGGGKGRELNSGREKTLRGRRGQRDGLSFTKKAARVGGHGGEGGKD